MKNVVKIDTSKAVALTQNMSTIDKSKALAQSTAIKDTAKKTQAKAETKRDVKEFVVHLALDKQSVSQKRNYCKRAHNTDLKYDETEVALKTLYRDAENKEYIYNIAKAQELITKYINEIFLQSKKDFFISSDVERHYKVFGQCISDNTLNAIRKMIKNKVEFDKKTLHMKAIYASDVSSKVRYYEISLK